MCPLVDLIRRSSHIGGIQAVHTALGIGFEDRLSTGRNPLLITGKCLVGQAVVILDHVCPTLSDRISDLGKTLH